MKIRVREGLKAFGITKMMFNVRSVSLGEKRKLYERALAPTVTYAAETWGMRWMRDYLDVLEIKYLRSICGVTRVDKWRNEGIRCRVCVRKKSGC